MGQDINFDWNLAGPPRDYVGETANAFNIGRQLAGQQIQSNAMQAYGADPTAPLDPRLAAANPAMFMQTQQAQQTAGDRQSTIDQAQAEAANNLPLAMTKAANRGATGDVMQLREQQRQGQLQQIELLKTSLAGLMNAPGMRNPDGTPNIANRLGAAQHILQRNPGLVTDPTTGQPIDPSHLTPDMLTDQGLAQGAAGLAAQERALMTQDERTKADEPLKFGKDEHVIVPAGSRFAPQPGQGAPAAAGATAAPTGAAVNASAADRDALTRAIYTEAGGEPLQGQAAVAHVILNRAAKGYGGATSISDVVHAPGQFEGMTSSRAGIAQDSPAYQHAQQVADQVLSGAIPDPTGGADHFLNPVLQGALGRNQPKWANGNGLRIGNHVFYGGQGGNTAPYQVASVGATPPPPSGVTPAATGPASAAPTAPSNVRPGYIDLNPGAGGGDDDAPKNRFATPAEITKAGGDPASPLWWDGSGHLGPPKDGMAPAPPASGTPAPLSGPAALNGLAPDVRALAQGMIDGRTPVPTGAALRNPKIVAAYAAAAQADPTLNAATFPERAKTFQDAFGTAGKTTLRMKALNTAIDHAETLSGLYSRLNNNDTPILGPMVNAFQNATDKKALNLTSQIGPLRQQLAIEAANAAQGGAPHAGEVQGYLNTLKDQNAIPTEQQGALKGLVGALQKRLIEETNSYNRSKGAVESPLLALSPDAQRAMARMQAFGGGQHPGQPKSTPGGVRYIGPAQ